MSKVHTHEAPEGTLALYFVGFILSIILTLAAYFLVVQSIFSGVALVIAITVLALVQLLVQLIFFLHLGRESKPRWNLMAFLFMILVVLIIGVGSIWIMYNLDYNMMPAHETDQHMKHESEKGF